MDLDLTRLYKIAFHNWTTCHQANLQFTSFAPTITHGEGRRRFLYPETGRFVMYCYQVP
jgi:hypothetical protein